MFNFKFEGLSQEELQELANDIYNFCQWFKTTFDMDIYLAYGQLLGAYRDKTLFMTYDHDIDLAYISKQHKKELVAKETNRIYSVLNSKGLLKENFYRGLVHVWIPPKKKYWIDLWTSWTYYCRFYSSRKIIGHILAESVLPLKNIEVNNHKFNIPNNPEVYLRFIYGKTWQKPRNMSKKRMHKIGAEPKKKFFRHVFGEKNESKRSPFKN